MFIVKTYETTTIKKYRGILLSPKPLEIPENTLQAIIADNPKHNANIKASANSKTSSGVFINTKKCPYSVAPTDVIITETTAPTYIEVVTHLLTPTLLPAPNF